MSIHLFLLSLLFPFLRFIISPILSFSFFFFFNDTATTEIYTLSLHDALPILSDTRASQPGPPLLFTTVVSSPRRISTGSKDRKSTRLNSSHLVISYAVFCLKKKKKKNNKNMIHVVAGVMSVCHLKPLS